MNFKKVSALACAMTIVGGMATSVPVFANTIDQGTTPVTYDNREVLPDGNGEYGMIIPTAITFDDKKITSNADISITGINGWDLTDWETLTVEANVQSENEYKLKLNGNDASKYAEYSLKYNGDQPISTNEGNSTSDVMTATKINKTLGVGGSGNVEKVPGEATLGSKAKATEKGQYKDVLTYSFKEVANSKKLQK